MDWNVGLLKEHGIHPNDTFDEVYTKDIVLKNSTLPSLRGLLLFNLQSRELGMILVYGDGELRKASIFSSTTHPQFVHSKPIDANPTTRSDPSTTGDSSCDYSDGSWVYDPNAGFDRYNSCCKEIFKGWNCILNNKFNGKDISKDGILA
ncbi:hypothetical protein J1N35_040639 [Gossypium stocksii]|uniref:Trichome birefringence-like N-terminal domain-containing protein n=1 Tax=Gossypium stocksii TaxID=47602 RepID=A0A9D3UE81_9ROSI|nr:hypothetical protein J1N35_040639 [Gossypium stocksii]